MSSLNQTTLQKLMQKLSPQQIQMIKLLELPTLQLEQRIKQEIEENPVLDDEEMEIKPSSEDEEPQAFSVDDFIKNEDIPNYKYYANNYSKDDTKTPVHLSDNHTFQEFLKEQLSYKQLNDREKTIAEYIIGSLDDDGYLRRELESLCDDIAFSTGVECDIDEIEEMLKVVQELEPSGVGARTLQECLLLQLNSRVVITKSIILAREILMHYFDEFTKKHYEKLMSRLNVSLDEFRDAIEEIVRLSPRPGNTYAGELATANPHITPDFLLDYQNGKFDLVLNHSNVPDIKINNRYVEMIQDMAAKGDNVTESDKETIQFVKHKIDSAKWFISAIKQRHNTLLQTMNAILDYQQEYFKDGDQTKLRPMILKDIADITGLDVSTISRVVNSKYIQTHFGIFLLKTLFSEAMQTESGEEVSSYEIKKTLQDCIDNEDKRKPLTDETLMEILNGKGYHIARRTVAKYREMLGIPVARLRKEL